MCSAEISGPRGGVFTDKLTSIATVTDGTSNTAAFSDRMLGDLLGTDPNGGNQANVLTGLPRPDPSNAGYNTDNALATCLAGPPKFPNDGFYGIGAGSMINGELASTMYNHILPPNSPTRDCKNGGFVDSNNETAIVSARSRHPGVVNVVAADGSVRSVKSTVNVSIWQGYGTAKGGEILSSDAF